MMAALWQLDMRSFAALWVVHMLLVTVIGRFPLYIVITYLNNDIQTPLSDKPQCTRYTLKYHNLPNRSWTGSHDIAHPQTHPHTKL